MEEVWTLTSGDVRVRGLWRSLSRIGSHGYDVASNVVVFRNDFWLHLVLLQQCCVIKSRKKKKMEEGHPKNQELVLLTETFRDGNLSVISRDCVVLPTLRIF